MIDKESDKGLGLTLTLILTPTLTLTGIKFFVLLLPDFSRPYSMRNMFYI
jgi:hypothetical protein